MGYLTSVNLFSELSDHFIFSHRNHKNKMRANQLTCFNGRKLAIEAFLSINQGLSQGLILCLIGSALQEVATANCYQPS